MNELSQQIAERIANTPEQKISFREFMRHALYTPNLGYYCQNRLPIGESGDFVTAPEISALFSQCLARQALEIFKHIPDSSILELGAGLGSLACDVLLYLEKENSLPVQYFILDLSGSLQCAQKERIQQYCPHLLSKVVWLSTWPENFSGLVIANEVLDAMPVDILRFKQEDCQLAFITHSAKGFDWRYDPIEDPDLQKMAEDIRESLPQDALEQEYITEINPTLSPWFKGLSEHLVQAVVLIIDYGFLETEYYHPDRSMGTLMCHYQQQAHADPLIHIGQQDLTAHVDFSAVIKAATQAEFNVLGYTTQASFLLALGLLDLAGENLSLIDHYALAQQIKYLTLPSEMGELFKVLALGKNYTLTLSGFKKPY